MKRTRLAAALVLALAGFGSALASPAQDLFDQAAFYLRFYYGGWSTVDREGLADKYQPELDQACAAEKDTCAYDKARPVVEKMIAEVKDGHTYLVSPQQYQDAARSQAGLGSSALRIGISSQPIDDGNERLIIDVVENGPAEAAGFQRGDRITQVNGVALKSMSKEDAAASITKAVTTGQPVRLTVVRGGTQTLEFSVTGKVFETARMPSLKLRPDGIAILRIPDFEAYGKVGARTHELVREAQAKGAKALIVDLRNNGGGSDTVATTGAFVRDFTVISESPMERTERGLRSADGSVYTKDLKTNREVVNLKIPNATVWTGPLVVLVNQYSASASEYLASAVQAAKVGTVVGETTAGVGNTSTFPRPLVDGSALYVTIVRSMQKDGKPFPASVKPDVEVKDDLTELGRTGRDLPLEKALELLATKSALLAPAK